MKEKFTNMKSKAEVKGLKIASVFATSIATVGANSSCLFLAYQDEIPSNAKKLRAF